MSRALQFLVFIVAYPFLWGISRLPDSLFYGLSDAVRFLIYNVIGYRKKVVRNNLKLAFPDKKDPELEQIEGKFYTHLCDVFMEMIKTMSLSKEGVKRRFELTNVELLRETLKTKSVILLCAHYANWEWNVSINNQVDAKGYAVYQRIQNRYFDNFIRSLRARWNTIPITREEIVKEVIKNHKADIRSCYGMVSDQSPMVHPNQYWAEFMGIKVPVFTGGETMARKMDLAVLYISTVKVKRGHYALTFTPITLAGSQTETHEITDRFLRLTEQQIRNAPEHYLWTHKRWKHRHRVPEAYQ